MPSCGPNDPAGCRTASVVVESCIVTSPLVAPGPNEPLELAPGPNEPLERREGGGCEEGRAIALTGASSSAKVPSNNAADFLFPPKMPASKPRWRRRSCRGGKGTRWMLVDLALGVPAPVELAGELGCDAIRNCTGWIGGLEEPKGLVPTTIAFCTLGGV